MNRKLPVVLLLMVVLLTAAGCSEGVRQDGESYIQTNIKVTDGKGSIIKTAEVEIEGVKVKGKNGSFAAPLKNGQQYTIKADARYYAKIRKKYKAVKGGNFITLPLTRQKYDLTGTIFSGKNAVSGADVKITALNKTVVTGQGGKFHFKEIPAGLYSLAIKRSGYNEVNKECEVCSDNLTGTAESGTDKNAGVINIGAVNLNALPTKLKGRVLARDTGKPMAGKAVRIGKEKSLTTDKEGRFTAKLPEGNYKLIIDCAAYKPLEKDISLSAGMVKDIGTLYTVPLPGGIEGRVVNVADGKPVRGVTVEPVNLDKSVTTDDRGRYVIPQVRPGDYSLKVVHDDFTEIRKNITVTRGQVAELNIKLTAFPGTVKGITQPGAGVKIRETGDSTAADDSGNFRLKGIVAGNYTLIVDHREYRTRSLAVEVEKNRLLDLGKIMLEPAAGSVRGRVVKNSVVDLDGSVVDMSQREGNNFTFKRVSTGEHRLKVTHPDYQARIITFKVGPGEDIDLGKIELTARPGSISGRVVDNLTGENIKNAAVVLQEIGQSTTTDTRGEFNFSGIKAGSYSLIIQHDDYREKSFSVDVSRNAGTAVGPVELGLLRGTISGRTDPGNVSLSIGDYNTVSGPDGRFYLDGIIPGTYTLTAGRENYISRSIEDVIIEPDTSNELGTVSLQPEPGEITGRIEGEAGHRIDGAVVRGGGKEDTTDTGGHFALEGLAPGVYTLTVTHVDFAEKTAAGTRVEPGSTEDMGTIVLKSLQPEEGDLIVDVRNSDGFPVNSRIELVEKGWIRNSDNYHRWSGLEEGTYNIKAEKEGYTSQTEAVSVIGGRTAVVNFVLRADGTGAGALRLKADISDEDPDDIYGVAGYYVNIYDNSGRRVRHIHSDGCVEKEGSYEVFYTQLIPGDYRLELTVTERSRYNRREERTYYDPIYPAIDIDCGSLEIESGVTAERTESFTVTLD